MRKNTIYIKLFLLMSIVQLLSLELFAYQECDTIRNCVGRDLEFSVTSGKGAHYIDIDKTAELDKISEQLTVEFWLKVSRQENKRQYIAGVWGPGYDNQDSWVIYIDDKDSLTFEINGGNPALGGSDNTILKINAIPLYDKWEHLAFVFDGRIGYLYIYNYGNLVAIKRNSLYPVRKLKQVANSELSIQIGSTNALSNDMDKNRTMLGFIDEIRIWGRALSADDINCRKEKALSGTEDSLMVYFRCNVPNVYDLCDASGHNNWGRMRSGISIDWSNRKVSQKVVLTPSIITDTIICDLVKTYTVTITDTNECSAGVNVRVIGEMADKFNIIYNSKSVKQTKWVYIPLTPNVPVSFQVQINSDFIGTIHSTLELRNQNSCGWFIADIPLNITRYTELLTSNFSINFDSLKARCIEKSYIDSIITITNITGLSALPKNITISKIESSMPEVFEISVPALPYILIPNNSLNIPVRFKAKDTNALYNASLLIVSTDRCEDTLNISLNGKVRKVLKLTNDADGTRLDSIDFGRSCINFPSAAMQYLWENIIESNILIDSIIMPDNFIGKPFKYPVVLTPVTGYMPNYFRFLPKVPGNFNDSIVFVVKSDECTIMHPVYVHGLGFDANIKFIEASIDFANVKVGQESTINVQLKNNSDEDIKVSIYLKRGIPFYLNGAKSITVAAHSTASFPLTFIPTDTLLHTDGICIYENSCFQSECINISAKGYIDLFDFIPEIMKIEKILACENKDGIITIKNASPVQQTLSDFNLFPLSSPFTLVSPLALPTTVILEPSQTVSFTYNYFTNDVAQDRVDYAYLYFKSSDNQQWSAKLYGSSIIPKLYVTDEILFETIEVGATINDTVRIENISTFDIKVDSLSIGAGFNIIYPLSGFPKILKPRDSIMVIISFNPTEEKVYTSLLNIYSSSPCEQLLNTYIEGRAIIVPLDAPLKVISYGYVPPCNCLNRVIPLINNSHYFDMSIDSIWIDDEAVANPYPEYFSWNSFYSPTSSVPYSIPMRSTDTITISYCPKSPFINGMLVNDARLHIRASGNNWSREFTTYLSGKETMMYSADRHQVNFPPTRVDTFATSEFIDLSIPSYEFNPKRSDIKIEKISFVPDERVFYYANDGGSNLPFSLDSTNDLRLKLDFKPRAVRDYSAKMKIELSGDCYHSDTTITLTGSGYAPAFGLDFNFENNKYMQDTFRVINCKSITIPIYSSRILPANTVDIKFKLDFDTNKIELNYADSPYLSDTCSIYLPSINYNYSALGGIDFLLKNFCNIDSNKQFIELTFTPKIGRDTLSIGIDSIKFDTEEVILYHLIAQGDDGVLIILKPELEVINTIEFDSVQVLDCKQDTIIIVNTGDIEISEFDVLNNFKDINIISYSPSIDSYIQPHDTLSIIAEFCPRKKQTFDSIMSAISNNPCLINDTVFTKAMSYAPPFEVQFNTDFLINTPDTLSFQIGDTLYMPIITEKSFSALIKGTKYYLEDLNFNINIKYKPQALKFLSANNSISSEFNFSEITQGHILLKFENTPIIDSGQIAEILFLAVVPDTLRNKLTIESSDYTSDSIMFLDIIPINDTVQLVTIPKCGISYLKYSNKAELEQNKPNPWTNYTEIEFSIREKSNVNIKLYNPSGILARELLSGEQTLPSGKYKFVLNSEGLESGIYYYTISSGIFTDTKKMVLIK